MQARSLHLELCVRMLVVRACVFILLLRYQQDSEVSALSSGRTVGPSRATTVQAVSHLPGYSWALARKRFTRMTHGTT